MPWILIALAAGLLAGGAAGVYVWRHPEPVGQTADGTALLALGLAFITAGVVFVLTDHEFAYSWVPVGAVFLGVGARQRRAHRTRH